MKTKVKKLNTILKAKGYSSKKRLKLKVYLSIVLLGKKIPEVALYFGLSEKKVEKILIIYGVNIKRDKSFLNKIRQVVGVYFIDNELKLAS